jgi:hypothetical protein
VDEVMREASGHGGAVVAALQLHRPR